MERQCAEKIPILKVFNFWSKNESRERSQGMQWVSDIGIQYWAVCRGFILTKLLKIKESQALYGTKTIWEILFSLHLCLKSKWNFMLEAIFPVIFKMHPKFVIYANFHVLRWIKGEFKEILQWFEKLRKTQNKDGND